MKIVSVMTTSSAGGAEFAAIEMLDALADRGHEVVMLSDQADIGRDSQVRVDPFEEVREMETGSRRERQLRFGLLSTAPGGDLCVEL